MSPQHVAATSRRICTHRVMCSRDLLPRLVAATCRLVLNDTSLQHFAATNHSVCTGRAITCCNKLSDSSRRQIASCVLVNSCANLCLSRQQVAQIQSDLLSCNFFRRQNSPVHTERFVVAATCCCNLSPSVFRP